MLLANTGGELTALEGIILLVVFAAFMSYTVFLGLREGDSGHDDLDPETQLEPHELDVYKRQPALRIRPPRSSWASMSTAPFP